VKFTVIWSFAALNELAEIWLRASDRQAITDAAEAIDQLLEADPIVVGESRDGGRRILINPPLVVIFNVSVESGAVVVVRVRCSRREASGHE
jgi:plasmid stabilization system protein ParE